MTAQREQEPRARGTTATEARITHLEAEVARLTEEIARLTMEAEHALRVEEERAEAAEARVQELEREVTQRVDEERRRWCRALEEAGFSKIEGLAPEVVAGCVQREVEGLEREVARPRCRMERSDER